MSLNIKNAEAYKLANELARLTGHSMTAVVLEALRKQRDALQRERQKEAQVQDLMAIAKRCAVHIQQPGSALDHGAMLYDDHGLPQ
jgi:antitoxin VapB